MNRREFSLQVAGIAGAAALGSLVPGLAFASPTAPVEGTDYDRLKTPLTLPKTGKFEVIEFFWYGCPHCNAFEPTIEPWIAKLPADVNFHRVHVQFNARQEIHQRIYYTWETLGLLGQMHAKTFARFHVERKPIDSEDDMLAFARENGLDVAKVKATWNSFAMTSKIRQAQQQCDDYRVDGVPMIGIHGRYTTAPSKNGGAECLQTTDALVALLRKTA